MMCIILLTQVLRNRIEREKTECALWLVSQDFAMYVCVFLKFFINEIIQMFLCFAKISIF